TRSSEWTRERLADLSKQELANLHANAVRLGETDLATLCDEVLKDRPRRGPASSGAAGRSKGRNKLLPRSRAFGARGVWLQDALEGRLPEDRARSVLGIDAETVIQFHVELRGAEYWATWGKKAAKGSKVE